MAAEDKLADSSTRTLGVGKPLGDGIVAVFRCLVFLLMDCALVVQFFLYSLSGGCVSIYDLLFEI